MKENSNKRSAGEILSVAVVLIIFLALLAFVVFAAGSYRSAVQAQQERDEERAVLSYISTAVRSDRADLVSLETINGLKILAITDEETGFEQRIYFRDGKLMENFGMHGTVFPEGGETVIGHPEFIEMNMDEDGLLKVKTDLGTAYVRAGKS